MKKSTKVSLLTAVVLIGAGLLICFFTFLRLDGDYTRLSTAAIEETQYILEEPFDTICISAETMDVDVIPSDTGKSYVVSRAYENCSPVISIRDRVLTIRQTDNRPWREHIGIFLESPRITVYLAESEYNGLSIALGSGDAHVPEGFSFIDARINNIRGDVSFSASVENEFTSYSEFGDITLSRVLARKILCQAQNGDIHLTDCDAAFLDLETTNGDVAGTLLSPKAFDANAVHGEVYISGAGQGGPCKISTVNGDINVWVK